LYKETGGTASANEAATANDCKLIKGDTTNGVFIRTMIKTQIDRLLLPDALKTFP
jgi:hypothetical protein